MSFHDSNLIAQALASLDFLVVQDMFLTETAKLANVVLPAASLAEKEGTFTNFVGKVQRVRKAIEPLGESLPDWEIILLMAEKMGATMPYTSPQQVMSEIVEACHLSSYGSHEGIGHIGSEVDILYGTEASSDWGVGRLYGGQFTKGFACFCPVQYVPQSRTKGDYPLKLLSGSILYHFGSGTRSSRSSRLNKFSPQAFVEVGELDANELVIKDGDYVKVISPAGEVTAVVRISDTLPRGVIFIPVSFPSARVVSLFGINLDSEAKTPSIKTCNVRIERTTSHE